MDISGFITRSNMPTPQANLPIQVDPYWTLLGDTQAAADMSTANGVAPALSAHKFVWANSPYVAGQQLVLATPDNSTLVLRLICDGDSMADAQAIATEIIEAVTQQLTYQVSLTYDTGENAATYAWNCYTADYEVAFNQLLYFGYLLPLYLTMQRDPTPVSGPV